MTEFTNISGHLLSDNHVKTDIFTHNNYSAAEVQSSRSMGIGSPCDLSHHRTSGSAYRGSYFGCHSRYESNRLGYPFFFKLALDMAICRIGVSVMRQ